MWYAIIREEKMIGTNIRELGISIRELGFGTERCIVTKKSKNIRFCEIEVYKRVFGENAIIELYKA